MNFFLGEWKNGASYTKGLSVEEFFYEQIFTAIKENVKNKTLPFFNNNIKALPRELISGKLINDENLVALEQIAAKKGYNSSLWIYGADLEKLSREGIKINLKRDAEPALCLTKFKNAEHNSEELYISDGGSKGKVQFLYNFDSLDERSQKELQKYYQNTQKIDKAAVEESYSSFKKNIQNEMNTNNKNIKNIQEKILNDRYLQDVDCMSMIQAQYYHMVFNSLGGKMKNTINTEKERNCYSAFSKIFDHIKEGKLSPRVVAENITKKLYQASIYQKTMTSHNASLEHKKLQDEKQQQVLNLHKKYNTWER